jgi:hypothetical protein
MEYCMGIEKNRKQCMKCKHLPESAEEEDRAEKWIDHKQMANPCIRYLARKKV